MSGSAILNIQGPPSRLLRRARGMRLSDEIEWVRLRRDGAGYQEDVMSMQAGKTSSTGIGRMPRSSRVNA